MQSQTVEALERRKRQLLEQLQVGDPQMMWTHSHAEGVPVDVVHACSDLNREIALLEGIARGELAITQEEVMTHCEARARVAHWLT